MGKGEIARYEQFLLFPTEFSKDLCCRHGPVWERVNKHTWEKEKLKVISIFSFSDKNFYTFKAKSFYSCQIYFCHLLMFSIPNLCHLIKNVRGKGALNEIKGPKLAKKKSQVLKRYLDFKHTTDIMEIVVKLTTYFL